MQLLVVFLMLILNLFINAIYWEHRGTNKLRLKMKTFRLIGMALLAVVMSVNFASCSSDDDEEPTKNDDGVITNQKRLVEFTETDEHDTYTWSFSYDSKGRLISIVQKDYDSSSYITNITWGENTIRESEDDESITYSLTDGLARTGSETNGTNYSFAYNSSKQLTAYQRSSSRYDIQIHVL